MACANPAQIGSARARQRTAGRAQTRAQAPFGRARAGLFAQALIAFVSFAMLALALRELSVATAYAIWSAVGTAVVAVLGAVFFSERLTAVAVLGIALIMLGVVLVTVSGSATHG